MKTRLLFTVPASGLPKGTPAPPVPTVLLEGEGITLFSTGATRLLDYDRLEDVTTAGICAALRLGSDTFVYLPPVREVPESMDIFSWEFAVWRQNWWTDVLAEVVAQGCVPMAIEELVRQV